MNKSSKAVKNIGCIKGISVALNKLYTELSTAVDNSSSGKVIHSPFLIITKPEKLFKKLSTKNTSGVININMCE